MKILSLSDPHWDFHRGNPKAAQFFEQDVGDVDMVVVPGDVSNDEWGAETFFRIIARNFPNVPKIVVPGNHDVPYLTGPGAYGSRGALVNAPTFIDHAKKNGFVVPDPNKMFEVVDGILLFNVFYSPYTTDKDMYYTNDHLYFDVKSRCKSFGELPENPELVKFSVSHLSPNVKIPTSYTPGHKMFYNTGIDTVLRHFGSKTHLLGHTHEWADCVVDNVRYVNCPVSDPSYDFATSQKKSLKDFVVEI